MLTNTHFIILVVVFVISIFLGLLLRIFFQVKGSNFFVDVANITVLTFFMPILAYRDISKHKTKYIAEINKDNKLSEIDKKKLKRILSSNKKIAWRIFWVSITRTKTFLDLHIHMLNKYYEEQGYRLLFVSSVSKVNVKEQRIYKSEIYKNLIYAYA
ncbi:hypothetical protein [Aeribacillus pallidus]|uniref:hypothetical protein n=1 Tax=Aeribacillus pallidus TaxID=33936 RepID=UPI003D1EA95F